MTTPERARVFVTPHAMERFRERIWRSIGDEDLIRLLQEGVAAPQRVKARTLADGTPSWTVRVAGQAFAGREFSYRVVIVPPPADQPHGWPVVGTVLHGSSGVSRGTKLPPRARAVER